MATNRDDPGNVSSARRKVCQSLKCRRGMDVGWLIRGWAVVGIYVCASASGSQKRRARGILGPFVSDRPQGQYAHAEVSNDRCGSRKPVRAPETLLVLDQSPAPRVWKTILCRCRRSARTVRNTFVHLVSSRNSEGLLANCYSESDDENVSVDIASIWAMNLLSCNFNDASCVSSASLQTASGRMMA